jgi:hypothetical protein
MLSGSLRLVEVGQLIGQFLARASPGTGHFFGALVTASRRIVRLVVAFEHRVEVRQPPAIATAVIGWCDRSVRHFLPYGSHVPPTSFGSPAASFAWRMRCDNNSRGADSSGFSHPVHHLL